MDKYCQLHLTCADKYEADKIANALLVKHLAACVRQVRISSDFHWQGKIEHADEVMLIMESRADLFDQIEAEVKKLHSYDTFVLGSFSVDKINREAAAWLKEIITKS